MKKITLVTVASAAILLFTNMAFGQVPNLGTAADYVLFTTSGAVGNTGTSYITGNVGTNSGAITAFGNVDGVVNAANATSLLCSTDLLSGYNDIMAATNTSSHGPILGGGEILAPGVYSLAAAGSIAGIINLDAGSDPNALFIFKIGGAFTTGASTEIILLNGAQACNVFWAAEGAVALAASTIMKGTLIAHNAAISMAAGCKLEGRLFSTTGAVAIDGSTARLPLGCAAILTGPAAPALGTTECYALFTANGALTNTGLTSVTGDIGTNLGATTGFAALNVTGTIHTSPDASTILCATDLTNVVSLMTAITSDIELLFPAQLGNKLQLTPHAYFMNGAATLTDSLFLNAQDNVDAVFFIFIDGSLTAAASTKVILMNGAQSKNVFWLVNGDVNLNDNSLMVGTLIITNGNVDITMDGYLDGRALTTLGSFTTDIITAVQPTNCATTGINSIEEVALVGIYPNPFKSTITIQLNNIASMEGAVVSINNVMGQLIFQKVLVESLSVLNVSDLPSGIYNYTITNNHQIIQLGQLIAE